MKRFDWKLKYLLQLVMAVVFLIGLGLAYKLYDDEQTSLSDPGFRGAIISIFVAGFITVAVVYIYSLITQFFKKF
ncbi:hypothetical protein [Asticcacaulis benevestitus]|uniref:Uncharacterized protein n=1 Tax=Asticcacaulis benevestitus DSM 16100 = ATCC BAA-896 TaxID=1121022 RepID=V4PBZ8_9CAUL|nr:hypothetical protein [Asticcacaulis benevestitus]ESQ82815.1 hypothetical protein ABENE_20715 [Asticcacaulis benevestitus DSM 16100 = ATCC BAA-896]